MLRIRSVLLGLGTASCLLMASPPSQALIPTQITVEPVSLYSSLNSPELAFMGEMPRRVINRLRRSFDLTPSLLITGLSLATGAFIALTWLHLYQQQRRWQRLDLVRAEAKAFRECEPIKNVLDIIDYEEYRIFYATHPQDGRQISFEASDYRLKRALRSHSQMVKMRKGLDEIKQLATKHHQIPPKTLALVEEYDNQEFFIEITLRDWFDAFLNGLASFEVMIESGLATAEEVKPFIIYWIRLIGDRRYRRQEGSGFYDQLFHYIHWAGYWRVQNLFERYGFKILPPPYSSQDFLGIYTETKFDTYRALCLAKAAHLVYEDRAYVADITRLWLKCEADDRWKQMTDRQYVIDVIKNWLKEGEPQSERDILIDFQYLNMQLTDTQAFLLRKDNNVILIFKGTQQFSDWKTNLKLRLKDFSILADPSVTPPKGRVHRGFLAAWQSVEKQVIYYLNKWRTPDAKLWVAGHSLGGALAAIATISLDTLGYEISGLYTFGQPRVADWQLVNHMNKRMGNRIFRYVNNNDIVPLVPMQIIPWMPTRVYGHMGQFRYFNDFGVLRRQSFLFQRFPDRLFGLMRALIVSRSPDAVDDHRMEFYIANLQKAVEQEEKEAELALERELISGEFVEDLKERLRKRRR